MAVTLGVISVHQGHLAYLFSISDTVIVKGFLLTYGGYGDSYVVDQSMGTSFALTFSVLAPAHDRGIMGLYMLYHTYHCTVQL